MNAKTRRYVYIGTICLMLAGFISGALTPEQVGQAVDKSTQIVAALAALLALLNVADD